MRFDSDVFVSYAHIDDQSLAEGQKGWISSFHRALEVRLGQLLGKEPRIWRDPKLQGNDLFADKLVDRLPRAALLVSVLSPRYVKSDWCTREVREFLKAAGGARVGDKLRVFKVVKTPVPLEQHPPELQKVLGYDFYTVEPETGRARELSPQLTDPDAQRRYWARLDDLAHDISELLALLEDGSDDGERPAGAGEARAVYLAETSFDLKDKRDEIRRELLGHGFAVLPDRPLPLYGPECEAFVREQLGRCEMSIHLIGRNYGVVPDGATRSLVALQGELAAERSAGGGFPRLIWIPPGLATADERQQAFVEQVRTDPRAQQGADLLETPLDDFKTVLEARLRPRPEEPERGEAADDDGLRRVYLICDQRDVEAAAALEGHLFDQGFEVIVPVFEGDEAQVRRDHEESLVLCDAALVYHGAAGELWLRQKLREIQKSAGLGRTRPMRARAVFVGPPASPQKLRFRTHEALVLRSEQGFDPAVLAPFLEALR